ncbi:protein of unknown function (plasmid) [Denitratisoma oestradiolicum]|uniref:Uncharacterized protein n=1 Tax=Denitratisoma oestradiolicum TaxID=311182 RepID=A0A6S6Y3R9_9PROT|nr:type IV conjugative transfer system protein TraL [Denitratisoma oestradiolicum]CAB1371207.1 protein of unknown function [Denitratisoma oestradiolicum]
MSQTDLSHYIPRRLDDAGKFLFWELDVAAIAILGMLIGVATEFPISGSSSACCWASSTTS